MHTYNLSLSLSKLILLNHIHITTDKQVLQFIFHVSCWHRCQHERVIDMGGILRTQREPMCPSFSTPFQWLLHSTTVDHGDVYKRWSQWTVHPHDQPQLYVIGQVVVCLDFGFSLGTPASSHTNQNFTSNIYSFKHLNAQKKRIAYPYIIHTWYIFHLFGRILKNIK